MAAAALAQSPPQSPPQSIAAASNSAQPARAAGLLAQRPLSFEPNVGQAPAGAQWIARGQRYAVRMENRGPVLILPASRKEPAAQLAVTFTGAQAHPNPQADGRLDATTNYLLGADPGKWHRNVANYARVRYSKVYPGVDVVFYGSEGVLEYDFAVAPQTDVSRIRMHFEGMGRATVDPSGSVQFARGGAALRQPAPVAYQELAGVRRPVDVRYRILPGGDVGFSLGGYDPALPLVIDPTLSYATYLGGSGSDGVTSVKVDSAGNLYVAGYTSSANLQATGSLQGYKGFVASGQFLDTGDAFVAKYSIAGKLLYLTYLGGAKDDAAMALALDAAGNAYIAGDTASADFPVTAGAYQTKFGGAVQDYFYSRGDVFVVKLSPDGSKILYGTYIGGSMNDGAWGMAVDGSGNVTVVGDTISTDFPTTANAISRTYRGAANQAIDTTGDGFLARLNATGSALLYSTYLGGRSNDHASAVALDAAGNAYVCGFTYSSDFPITTGAYQTKFKGVETTGNGASNDAFVMKIDPTGALVYSTYLGGTSTDIAFGIAVDGQGNALVTGGTVSTDFPVTPGAIRSSYGGSGAVGQASDWLLGDAFVAKLNAAGSALVYSTYLGGASDEVGWGITADSSGNAYAVGFTLSSTFPVSADALQKNFAGFGGQGVNIAPAPYTDESPANTGDAFLIKLDPQGAMLYSSFFGGPGDDFALAVALDSGRNVYIGGMTTSASLPLANAAQSAYGGGVAISPRGDGFVARFDFGGALSAVPAAVSFSPGIPATGTAGAQLLSPVGVSVVDSKGVPIPGIAVAFSATGASVNPTGATTDTTGYAATTVTLGSAAGAATITATVAGLAPISVTVTVTAGAPVITSVTNTATLDSRLSPGSQVAVAGSNLPTGASASALVGGVAASLFGTPTAAKWVIGIPAGLSAGPTTVQIGASAPFTITLAAYAPALYTVDGSGQGQAVAISGTGKSISSSNPVLPGDTITISATGLGAVANNQTVVLPTATLAGIALTVLAANPVSSSPGQYAVGITLPYTIPAGAAQVLILNIGGFTSNSVFVPVGALPTIPTIASIQNGASFQDGFASNAWLTIKGINLAAVAGDTWDKAIVNGQLPTTLDGVSVLVGGQPAYVYFVSPTQINVVAPNVAPGATTVVVKNSLGTSATANATAVAEQPAFFTWPGSYAVASHFPDFTYAVKNGTFAGLTTVPAKPKDVLILWGTAFGATLPAAPTGVQIPGTSTFSTVNTVTVTVGGQPATVYGSALAAGFAALFQVAIQVPDGLLDGDYPVVATVNGAKSPATTMLTIKN
jgi:uncharacterized protein (TIGR03437 family)